MTIVVDFSALASKVSERIPEGEEVIVPVPVIALIEKEAREAKASGILALREFEKLKEMHDKNRIRLVFSGVKPRFVSKEEADWSAREIARIENAVLFTADELQARLAKSIGLAFVLIKAELGEEELGISKFFDEQTMSVHIKEGVGVFAKKGKPGAWVFEKIKENISRDEVEELASEIIEKAEKNPNAFIEIDKQGATVVQYGKYRIVITRPPFSRGIEITAVRPVAKLSLEDYNLPKELVERFEKRAEGIIIAGPPGAGKTTFAQALAEFYAKKGKIVKTIEHPRDLTVMPLITQYGHLEGDPEATGEILLLVRPDYTVYDEMRTTRDFLVYADMRLAGVGMIGVTHASRAIDAIQRFLGRLDMGVIPQVVDTVIFLKGGAIEKVYELELVVKVPSGMTEADLARPVVEVRDFFTKELEYEIYAYGEETTIVPVKKVEKESAIEKLAAREIKRRVLDIIPGAAVEVEVTGPKTAVVYADEESIPHLIGKHGKTIEALEKRLGLGITVRPLSEKLTPKGEVSFEITESRNTITFYFDKSLAGRQVDFYIGDNYLFSAVVSKKGKVKVGKKTEIGKKLVEALDEGKEVKVKLS